MAIAHPQTHQFESFVTNLSYARKMVRAGQALEVLSPKGIDTADFYRAAWVQSIAALEHWVQEEVLRRVAEEAAKDDPDMPRKLRDYPLPLYCLERVQRGESTTSEVVAERVRQDIARQTLQNPDAIAKVMALVTDVKVWREAAKWVNRWSQYRTSYDEKRLRGKYILLLRRRNQIAHDADLIDGDLKQRRPIGEADVTDALNWIERIALALAYALEGETSNPSGLPAPDPTSAEASEAAGGDQLHKTE
ncbi:hypothetical protein [Streptomyces sp. MUM 178J]|uniref:hypothetical protein n=1 Tax=Streptomyces sp. MUM 178J TaxID=2791991 RepID=UPI001F03AD8B|nr:hypothetical protein [Streptomyces sp. MUM 178J]WRQ81529.1 hypothetical protein I3F59_020455 [Streptomyces sp. MUM 178J]